MSEAKCETGGVRGGEIFHPTPPLTLFAATLPLQGRVTRFTLAASRTP